MSTRLDRGISLASLDCASAAGYDDESVLDECENDQSQSSPPALPDIPFPLHGPITKEDEDDMDETNSGNTPPQSPRKAGRCRSPLFRRSISPSARCKSPSSSQHKRSQLWNKINPLSPKSDKRTGSSTTPHSPTGGKKNKSKRSKSPFSPKKASSPNSVLEMDQDHDIDAQSLGYKQIEVAMETLSLHHEEKEDCMDLYDSRNNMSDELQEVEVVQDVFIEISQPNEYDEEEEVSVEKAQTMEIHNGHDSQPEETHESEPENPVAIVPTTFTLDFEKEEEHLDEQTPEWKLMNEDFDFDFTKQQQQKQQRKERSEIIEDESSLSSSNSSAMAMMESFVVQSASHASLLMDSFVLEDDADVVNGPTEIEPQQQPVEEGPSKKSKVVKRRKKKSEKEGKEQSSSSMDAIEEDEACNSQNTASTQSNSSSQSCGSKEEEEIHTPKHQKQNISKPTEPSLVPASPKKTVHRTEDDELKGLLQKAKKGDQEAFNELSCALRKDEKVPASTERRSKTPSPRSKTPSTRKSRTKEKEIKSPKRAAKKKVTNRRSSLDHVPSMSTDTIAIPAKSPRSPKKNVTRRRASMEYSISAPPLVEEKEPESPRQRRRKVKPVEEDSEESLDMKRKMAKLQAKLHKVMAVLEEQEATSQKVKSLQATVEEQHSLLEQQGSHVDSLQEKIALLQGRLGPTNEGGSIQQDKLPSAPRRRGSGSHVASKNIRQRQQRRASVEGSTTVSVSPETKAPVSRMRANVAPKPLPSPRSKAKLFPKLLGGDDDEGSVDGDHLLPDGKRRCSKDLAKDFLPPATSALLKKHDEDEDEMQMSWHLDEEETSASALSELQNSVSSMDFDVKETPAPLKKKMVSTKPAEEEEGASHSHLAARKKSCRMSASLPDFKLADLPPAAAAASRSPSRKKRIPVQPGVESLESPSSKPKLKNGSTRQKRTSVPVPSPTKNGSSRHKRTSVPLPSATKNGSSRHKRTSVPLPTGTKKKSSSSRHQRTSVPLPTLPTSVNANN